MPESRSRCGGARTLQAGSNQQALRVGIHIETQMNKIAFRFLLIVPRQQDNDCPFDLGRYTAYDFPQT